MLKFLYFAVLQYLIYTPIEVFQTLYNLDFNTAFPRSLYISAVLCEFYEDAE
jgi:hypothetical protein